MCTPGVGLPDQRLGKLPLRAPCWGSGWVLLPVELLRGREEESTDALDVALAGKLLGTAEKDGGARVFPIAENPS